LIVIAGVNKSLNAVKYFILVLAKGLNVSFEFSKRIDETMNLQYHVLSHHYAICYEREVRILTNVVARTQMSECKLFVTGR